MSKPSLSVIRLIPSFRGIVQNTVKRPQFSSQLQSTGLPFSTSQRCAASPAAIRPQSTQAAVKSTTSSLDPPVDTQNTIDLNEPDVNNIDWSKSFHGMSSEPFPKNAAEVLLAPISPLNIEIKPDGIVYLPEIHYRRILNKAFGPGGWGLAPRGDAIVTDKAVTREYALLAHGRLVSISRGEQDYFNKDGIPTASEGCKSNAMVRCCKDLGIASELWDPRFIREWKAKHGREVFVEHQISKKKTKIWLRKGDPVQYPYKET